MTAVKSMPSTARHGVSAYSNYKCRCDVCRSAWKEYMQKRRAARKDKRVEIDGKMVAAHLPDESHGKESTYTNHSCRCEECTEAQRVSSLKRYKKVNQREKES